MKQLYLCGAISNNPNYKKDFEAAYNKLISAGYSVVNPLEFCNESDDWKKCMRKCIQVLARNTLLALAVIDDGYVSKGRELELTIARALEIEIMSVDEWADSVKK